MNGSVGKSQQQAMDAIMSLVEDTQGAMIIGSFNGQQALKGLHFAVWKLCPPNNTHE
jgi:hypothetical protein